MENVFSIAALVVALVIAGGLIWFYKNGTLQKTDLTNIGKLVDSVMTLAHGIVKDDTVVSVFTSYAAKAVRIVEQLVKNEELEKDNALRKSVAHKTVEQLARADGVDEQLITDNTEVIDSLIEAAVNEMRSENAKKS